MTSRFRHTARNATRRSRDRGQATVEFALVLPILLVVMFACIEFGRAYWTYQQVSAAASEGARKAIVSKSDSNRTSNITATTKAAAPNLKAASMGVTITSTWAVGSTVTVKVTYPERIRIMGVNLFNSNLVASRTMRVEQ